MAVNPMSGPIPGENFTSDTKNYPWHRPPQFTSMNEAFEYLAENLMDEDVSTSILTMLEIGVPVSRLTDMIITAGIGGGKFTVDYGLLMAGPLSHMICLMARKMDLDVDLGIGKKQKAPTKAFFDALERTKGDMDAGEVGAEIGGAMGLAGDTPSEPDMAAPSAPPASGLGGKPPMAAAPPAPEEAPVDEQEQMLGA